VHVVRSVCLCGLAADGSVLWCVVGLTCWFRCCCCCFFFFSSRRRHTRLVSDWSSDVCSSDLLDLAFSLGLFAIFGIIRYRTDAIPIKEMTYLFVIIGLAVMNALVAGISIAEIALANVVLIGLAYGLEKVWLLRHESRKIILYERIDLVKAGNRVALKKDLEERTGIKINRVEVGRIDFLRDTALIKIFFFEDLQEGHYEESFEKEN